jgi:hypothetical protein
MCISELYSFDADQRAAILAVEVLRNLRFARHEMRGTESLPPEIVVGEMAVTENLQQGIAA